MTIRYHAHIKLLCLVLFLLTAAPAYAATASPTAERTARLAKRCKVWGAVRYLHPWVWTRDIDWDAALLRAVPKARAATNDEEFAAAVDQMFGDPTTRDVPDADIR